MLEIIQLVIFGIMLLLFPLYGNIRVWFLHTFILLLPVNTWVEKYPMVASTDPVLLCMLIVFMGDKLFSHSTHAPIDKYSKVVLCFLVVALTSLIFSHYPKRAFWATLGIGKFVFLFLYIRRYIDSFLKLNYVVAVFILSSIIPACYGLITGWHSVMSLFQQYNYPQYYRVSAGFPGGAIEFTYFILIVLSFLLTLWFSTISSQYRFFMGFIAILNLFCFSVTFTRNGYISLGVGLLTFIILLNRDKIWKMIGVIIGLVVIFILLPMPHLIVSRFSSLFSPSTDPSIMSRPMLWKGAINIFLHHPILGIGPGGFSYAFLEEYLPHSLISVSPLFSSAHNIIMNTMAELGLAGLLVLIYLVFIFAGSLFKVNAHNATGSFKYMNLSLIIVGVISLTFGLSDFVWWSQRSGILTGFILGIMAVSINMQGKNDSI